MERLEANPGLAECIADNLVKVFRNIYLTPAGVSCYWRMLVRW